MKPLKILEDENIHVVMGIGENGQGKMIAAYAIINSLSLKYKRRRFTLHIVSPKPRPLYFEELRDMILNNIAYTFVVRYSDLNYEHLDKLVEEIRSMNKPIYGIVAGDLGELESFFKTRNIPYEKI